MDIKMRKGSFCKYYALLFCALVISVNAVKAQKIYKAPKYDSSWGKPTIHPGQVIINLGADPATTAGITWRTTAEITVGMVEYIVASDSPQLAQHAQTVHAITEILDARAVAEARVLASYHSARLEKLTPNTLYAYRVGDAEHWSEWFQFKTAAAEPAPFSFIYFGDVQNYIFELWSRVIREAYRKAPDAGFMLYAGDLVETGHNDQQWSEWFQAGGWIHSSVPSLAIPGNHEYRNPVKDAKPQGLSVQWKPQFTNPLNGPKGLEETSFYSDYQGVRIIGLNCMEKWDVQSEWLETTLKNNPNKWTIVMYHYPIYSASSGRDNQRWRDALKPILERHKVDLVLQGHDHVYTRGHDNPSDSLKSRKDRHSIVYVVSVSGGKMYDLRADWKDYNATRDRKGENIQLFQVIHVDGNKLTLKSYTATGKLYDSFTILKRKNKVNKLVEGDQVIPETVRNR